MTLRLILTRHAKSSWNSSAIGDHDRPLNGRGRRAASAVGNWLHDNGHFPDLVLSSDSARTRETWARIDAELDRDTPEVVWLEALYHAPAQTLLDVLKDAGTAPTVLILGHNPGIAGFAGMVVRQAPRHDRFRDYPTAATAVIEFATDRWRDIDWGQGRIVEFVIPRDLSAS